MTIVSRTVLILFFAVNLLTGYSQQTAKYDDPQSVYNSAVDLFQKEKYGAAQESFSELIESIQNPFSPMRINAEYYDAICALELYHPDAAYKLNQFVINHPTNSRKNGVSFQLGKLNYRNKKYRQALESFEMVDITQLSSKEKSEYFFKSGYCYFKRDNNDKAKSNFNKVVNTNSKYSSPSKYYMAHINYSEGKYDEALADFKVLSEDPNFRAVAPYYVVQILFMQGHYTEVIEKAPPLLANATPKRASELNRVIGESYYHKGEYNRALPFLKEYATTARTSISRASHYKLGYCLLQTSDYDNALRSFQKTTGKNDSLAQYGYYYLGACYLALDQKQFAANAFASAYKLPYDREIREDALFKQAQLAFELSYDPYSKAIKALRSYIQAYPDSEKADEAYEFLFQISMATRNFEDAQKSLESIQKKGVDYKGNFQKITYYRGIELFNQFNYAEAAEMFTKARDYDVDKMITAESIFWMAESFYMQENYWGAKKYYLEFLANNKAKKLPIFNMANYNLGYVYFKRKEYTGAIHSFKEFIAKLSDERQVLVADAFLRLGDSWFISKNYDNAISYYDKAINLNAVDVDYAKFQKAKALGVLQRYPEKISTLKSIPVQHPKSSYLSEVYYELGDTYLVTHNNEQALVNFKKVATDYPKSNLAVKARLKSGLIYYNSNLNDLAIAAFKGVITEYPGTQESKEALASLRNIYVDMGKVEDYFTYANKLEFANITISEQDSVTYTSAENQYMNEDYENAGKSLKKYVDNFPEGAYLLSAHYFLAECLVKSEDYENALLSYEYVVSQPVSEYSEMALLKAADLSYDLGKYDTSLQYFIKLEETAQQKENIQEAWYGRMKNNFLLKNYEAAIGPADKLLAQEKISDEMKLEAMLIRANSLETTDEILLAKAQYKEIAEFSQGEAGAESLYKIALIGYNLKDYEAAEKELFKLFNNYASYDYWMANGFILLADIYVETGNLFQAKQTLQSILENYDGEDLKKVAAEKLDAILASENTETTEEDNESESINIEGEEVELEQK